MDKQREIQSVNIQVAGGICKAFSYSPFANKNCCHDISKNQGATSSKKEFLEEYREFLQKFEVDYDEKYIFKLLE